MNNVVTTTYNDQHFFPINDIKFLLTSQRVFVLLINGNLSFIIIVGIVRKAMPCIKCRCGIYGYVPYYFKYLTCKVKVK